MESSTSNGEAEKCQSSESGWTMYIGSPMHDTEDDNGDGEVDERYEEESYDRAINDYGKDVESDDSMASDASSMPLDSLKMSNGKYFEENKVIECHVSKYKEVKEPVDDAPVKKNRFGTRKNKVRKNQHLGTKNWSCNL